MYVCYLLRTFCMLNPFFSLRWAAWCCMWRRPTSCQWNISPTPTVTSTWTVSRWLKHTLGRGRTLSSQRSLSLSESVTYLNVNIFLLWILHCSFSLSMLSNSHFQQPIFFELLTFFPTGLQNYRIYLSVVSVTCPVKSTDLKSAWATKQKRAKKVTSVSTFAHFKTNVISVGLYIHLISFCFISQLTSLPPFHASISLPLSVHALPAESSAEGPDDWWVVPSQLPRASEGHRAGLFTCTCPLLHGEDHARRGVQRVQRGLIGRKAFFDCNVH